PLSSRRASLRLTGQWRPVARTTDRCDTQDLYGPPAAARVRGSAERGCTGMRTTPATPLRTSTADRAFPDYALFPAGARSRFRRRLSRMRTLTRITSRPGTIAAATESVAERRREPHVPDRVGAPLAAGSVVSRGTDTYNDFRNSTRSWTSWSVKCKLNVVL